MIVRLVPRSRVRFVRLWRLAAVGLAGVAVVVAGGCRESTEPERAVPVVDEEDLSTAEWLPVERQPISIAGSPFLTTSIGEFAVTVDGDFAVTVDRTGAVDPGPAGTAVGAVDSTGQWFELPEPDPVLGPQIARSGSTLVLFGARDDRLVVQTLASGSSSWASERVPSEERVVDGDWSVAGSSDTAAIFRTPAGLLVVGPDAEMSVLEQPQGDLLTTCVVGDALLKLATSLDMGGGGFDVSDLPQGARPESLEQLPLSDIASSWEPLPAPPSTSIRDNSTTCTPDGPLFFTQDGVEVAWSGAWNEVEPADRSITDRLVLSSVATGVRADGFGGLLYVDGHTGQVAERLAPGQWRLLDQHASYLASAGDSLAAIDADQDTVQILSGN